MKTTPTKPPAVPQDLWEQLTPSEQAELAPEDGGYRVSLPGGRVNYFTTWDRSGKALATYNKTATGWELQKDYRS